MSDLAIIIVSYNTVDYIGKAIDSIYQQTKKTSFSVTVVDNKSPDHSIAYLRKNYPQINLIESDSNLGFAGGVNLGVKSTQEKYILLLNPDTVILENAIDKLYQFALNHPNNHIWGGITLNNDRSINTHNAWAKLDTLTLLFSAIGISKLFKKNGFFNAANYADWDRRTIKEVDIVQGSFLMTSRANWDKIGGMDSRFFMYGEEADYCLKTLAIGGQPISTPDAKIIHHGGVSEKNFSGKMIKLLKGKAEIIKRYSAPWLQPIHHFLLLTYVANKTAQAYIAHFLSNQYQSAEKKAIEEEWKTIFNQRKDWLQGYPKNT